MPVLDNRIHVIDNDVTRRAKIAFGLNSDNFFAQVYQSIQELIDYPVQNGLILLNDIGTYDFSEAAHSIHAKGGNLPIALFGETPPTGRVVEAMLAGAVDYLEWPFDPSRVRRTIARIENDTTRSRLAQRQLDAGVLVSKLTTREIDVLRHLIGGFGNKGIAKELGISPRTVEVHRANMLSKLNVRSSSEAIRTGIYAGLDM